MSFRSLRSSRFSPSAFTLCVAALTLALSAPPAGAKEPLATLVGAPASFFGSTVVAVGDIDGDGVGDIAVGAPNEDVRGAVYVYSGANLNLLFRFQDAAGGSFGAAIAGVGDVDGDGRNDIAIGAPGYSDNGLVGSGAVFVYSGRDGRLLHSFLGTSEWEELGTAVAAAGDLDGDGHADVAAGAPRASISWSQSGRVSIYSGQLGSVLLTLTGPTEESRGFGFALARVGDLDGDGRADLAVGAPNTSVIVPAADPTDPFGFSTVIGNTGAVAFYSGANGSLIRVQNGSRQYEYLGYALAAAPDRNGDGVPDVIAGAPMSSAGGHWGGGAVYVLSGADGGVLSAQFGHSMYSMLGSSVAGGDVSGDNVGDVVAGAPLTSGNAGAAFVYSGSDGTVIDAHEGGPEAYGLQIGRGVAVIGDLNGDGIVDYAIGVPGAGGESNGAVYFYSGKP